MSKTTDWGKHAAFAGWSAVALMLLFGVLPYVRPANPNHPLSLAFFSKSISVPWPFATAPLLAAVLTTILISRRLHAKQIPAPPATTSPGSNLSDSVFSVHPTSLDPRVTDPNRPIQYTAKLRLSLENTSQQSIHVLPLSWLTAVGNISVQCGKSPYPEHSLRRSAARILLCLPTRRHKGSWRNNQLEAFGKWSR